MSQVEKLKQELYLAELEEKKNRKDEVYNNAAKMIGKCYSSHLFQRTPRTKTEFRLLKIIGVKVDDNLRVLYNCIRMNLVISPKENFIQLQSRDTCYQDTPFPSYIGSMSHEISSSLFDRVIAEVQAHAETYFDKIRELFNQTEWITCGDHSSEQRKISHMEKAGMKFIHLDSEPSGVSVKEILAWNGHPFLYGKDQLLFTKESIEIVKAIANEMYTNATSWGGSIWERDSPRIVKLNNFYKKHIKAFE